MTQRDTPQAINERATEWVARMDAGPLDMAAEAELAQWLALDERHRGALFRAEVVWRMFDRANALGVQRSGAVPGQAQVGNQAHLGNMSAPIGHDAGAAEGRGFGRRGVLWGSGAVAASLIAGGIGLRSILTPSASRRVRPAPQRIQTAVGEIRHVPLNDGSKAVVNTASTIEVEFTPAQRNVRLDAGEAWFEVAKNVNRPFVVAAGEARVRAVGTAFSVRRVAGGAEIEVTEGLVEVWAAGLEGGKRAIGAGTSVFVVEGSGVQAPVQDASGIDRRLAWREGAFKFEGETLSAATAEFNRYNSIKIEVDSGLATEKVVGRFRIDEPDTFARAVSTMFDARIRRGGELIRLARH